MVSRARADPVPVSEDKQGATDRAIAKWMKSTQRSRDDVILATKVCGFNERFTWLRGEPTRVSREQARASRSMTITATATVCGTATEPSPWP